MMIQFLMVCVLYFLFLDKKGGALGSAIHSYTLHGDPSTRQLIKHILRLVAYPIKTMLDRWIYDGQLEDKYNEVKKSMVKLVVVVTCL